MTKHETGGCKGIEVGWSKVVALIVVLIGVGWGIIRVDEQRSSEFRSFVKEYQAQQADFIANFNKECETRAQNDQKHVEMITQSNKDLVSAITDTNRKLEQQDAREREERIAGDTRAERERHKMAMMEVT